MSNELLNDRHVWDADGTRYRLVDGVLVPTGPEERPREFAEPELKRPDRPPTRRDVVRLVLSVVLLLILLATTWLLLR